MNGETLLTVEYERASHSEVVYNEDREEILRVEYNGAGQPTRFYPAGPVEGLNVSYDAQGRMQMWQRMARVVSNVYDEETGNLHETRLADGYVYKYTYTIGTKVSRGQMISRNVVVVVSSDVFYSLLTCYEMFCLRF